MEFDKLIRERYSVREFKTKEIETEKINELLEILKYVPTAVNAQPEKIYILKSEESLEKLNKVCYTYHAPLVLLIGADTNIAWHNPRELEYNTAEMDGSIVATYLMLKVVELGLGSVWIRNFNAREIQEIFKLPKQVQPICLLAVGYASDSAEPSPRHYQKKSLDELVEYK